MYVSGTARSGRYYVIVHFYQPHFLSFVGEVVITGQATSVLTHFRYCPYVSGCRAVGTSQYRQGMSESIYVGRQNNFVVTIRIPEDKSIWIVSSIDCLFITYSHMAPRSIEGSLDAWVGRMAARNANKQNRDKSIWIVK